MTLTKLAALVGTIPPYANARLTAAQQLLAANPDGRPTLAQIPTFTIGDAIDALANYQHDCQELGTELSEIAPSPSRARMREFGL